MACDGCAMINQFDFRALKSQARRRSWISLSSNQNASFYQVITSFDNFNIPRVVKKACCEDAADLPDSAEEWPRDKIVRLIELYRDTPAL
jgi:hypothetical protein